MRRERTTSNEAQQLYLLKLTCFLNVTKADCVTSEFSALLTDTGANKTLRIRYISKQRLLGAVTKSGFVRESFKHWFRFWSYICSYISRRNRTSSIKDDGVVLSC